MDHMEFGMIVVAIIVTTVVYFAKPTSFVMPLVIGAVFAIIIFGYKTHKKQQEEITQFCKFKGWIKVKHSSNHRIKTPYIISPYLQLEGKIASLPAKIMEGKRRIGKNTPSGLVIAIQIEVPDFSFSAENLGSKLAQKLGFKDINFPDDKEFSKRFVLKGPDELQVRTFFSPSLRQNLRDMPLPSKEIHAKDGWLQFCYFEKFSVHSIEDKFATIKEFLRQNKLL